MPIYWRNQLYSEEEREQLWIAKLDEGIRFIGGEKMNWNAFGNLLRGIMRNRRR
jgi:hypothetical protein